MPASVKTLSNEAMKPRKVWLLVEVVGDSLRHYGADENHDGHYGEHYGCAVDNVAHADERGDYRSEYVTSKT